MISLMQPSKIDLILQSKLSLHDVTLEAKQRNACREAMLEYALRTVDAYRTNEIKAVSIEQVKLIPSLWKGELKLWFRKWNYKKAKKIADDRARIERRKMYCILSTDIQYVVISNKEIDYLKKIKKISKAINFIDLEKMSDYIAFPPQYH
jgi:hypothetical protein